MERNHNADISNPNKGTNGTNSTYSKNQVIEKFKRTLIDFYKNNRYFCSIESVPSI